MQRLHEILGAERAATAVSQAVQAEALAVGAPTTGAVLVTCGDETESECARTFHEAFVRYSVPPLKFGHHAAFRLATIAGQYEWGAIRAAEANFAAAGVPGARKLMVVKVNAHTGLTLRDGAPRYGYVPRYGGETPCCRALDVLLTGGQLPSPLLAEALRSEGVDRLAMLQDPAVVDPRERGLRASLASARLQARKVVLDIQDYAAVNTAWLVAVCVSINRADRDTEILCGFYHTPDPARPQHLEYVGLGDDPAAFVLTEKNRQLLVSDPGVATLRVARDHRRLVAARADEVAADIAPQRDARIAEVREAVRAGKHRRSDGSGALLGSLLLVLGEVAPVPAALLLFARGVAGIHHTWKVHRLARDLSRRDDARAVLRDVEQRIDELPPEQRAAMLELLLEHY